MVIIISECELTFAIYHRLSVCLSSVCLLSVMFVHLSQAIEIFRNVSTPCVVDMSSLCTLSGILASGRPPGTMHC